MSSQRCSELLLQLQLLEQLVSRLDKIEQSVAATQQQQHQLSRQQERLETVTAESLRGMNGMGR